MKSALSSLFLLFGVLLVLVSGYLFYIRNYSNKLSFTKIPPNNSSQKTNIATTISIPKIFKTLPIIPSKINKGKWETTEQGISFLTSTPNPGQKGNSVLYGHNYKSLLGNLAKIKPGDEIIVTFSDNSKRTFVVDTTAEVSPIQTDIIDNTNDTRITLYTCSGFFDSKRFVVVAKPTTIN